MSTGNIDRNIYLHSKKILLEINIYKIAKALIENTNIKAKALIENIAINIYLKAKKKR